MAHLLRAPRVLHAMGSDGMAVRGAAEVGPNGTPDVALMISAAAVAVLAVTGTSATMIAGLAFFIVANSALSFAALFVLRKREPAVGGWAAWGHPWTTGAALAGALLFAAATIVANPAGGLVALAVVAASVPLYLMTGSRRDRPLPGASR